MLAGGNSIAYTTLHCFNGYSKTMRTILSFWHAFYIPSPFMEMYSHACQDIVHQSKRYNNTNTDFQAQENLYSEEIQFYSVVST